MKWDPNMIEIMANKSTPTTVAVAMSAAMLSAQFQYPTRVEPYEVQQVRGTHSDFMESLARPAGETHFAQQVGAIFNSFAQRQQRLGVEFEAAIFSDLESLYEA